MNKLVIVSYLNFITLKETSRKVLSEYEDFLVSIKIKRNLWVLL